MLNDIRYAFRLLRRSPGFAAIAILTLALGIGANTALFSLLDATVLKPLPFRDPDRLVDIREVQFKGTGFEQIVSGMTRERLAEWRAQHHIFDGIEAYKHVRPRQSDVSVGVAPVSPGLFPLLGVSPALGRGFTADEAVGAGAPVVLLTDGLWKRAFGADPPRLPCRARVREPPQPGHRHADYTRPSKRGQSIVLSRGAHGP